MRRRVLVSIGVGALALSTGFAGSAAAGQRVWPGHGPIHAVGARQLAAASGAGALCRIGPSRARNVLTSCDQIASPHNETAVAVNPTDPRNIIASANDYQFMGHGQNVTETVLSRAHVTFDGGRSWTDVRVPYPSACTGTGDPSLGFDREGTAYLTTLCTDTGGVLVTHSTDEGMHWSPQTVVDQGSATVFDDHSTLAAWGDGNVIVTWIPYVVDASGNLVTVPMKVAVSHDRGAHFGAAHVVSGSAPQCVGLTAPHACDQAWATRSPCHLRAKY